MSQPLTVSVLLKLIDKMSDPLKVAIAGSEKKLDSLGQKAQAAGQKMESIGLRLGGIGVAGQAGLSRLGLDLNTLVGKAFDAEKSLYGIATTAGLAGDKARVMVGQWTTAVNQIAVATNQSQERVTAAFQDMIAKGLTPETAVAMLKPIGQAATAAGADIQDMASAAQASFSKLKIPVEDVAKSLDIMAAAGKSGAFELRDMAGFFDKLTASAANLGISGQAGLAGLSAAAQIARRGTGDAAQAATNLDNFLGKLNASVTYKAFDEMGVDLGKLKDEAKASGDYIGYMATQIQKITGGDTAKVASLFNDIQAGAFVQGMLRDLDDYKTIRDEALAANGVAATDFATTMQSASAQVDQFKISASTAVTGGDAIKSIIESLTGLANWANTNPELAKWLIFGTAGAAIGGAAIAGIGAIVTAIGGLLPVLGTLAAFLIANPLVLTILGLAAVGVAAFKFGTFLSEQIDLAVQAVTGDKFASLGSKIYDMVQWFKGLPDKIKAAIKGWVADFKAVGANIMQGLIDGITAKYDAVIAKIKGLGAGVLSAIKGVLDIRSPSGEMEAIGEYTVQGMTLGMENEEATLVRTAGDIGTAAMDAFQKPFRDNKGRFLPADEAQRAAAEWQNASNDIERSLTDALMNAFEGGQDWASGFVDTLKNMFNNLVLKPIIQPIAQGISQMATQLVTGALGLGGSGVAGADGGILGSFSNGIGAYNSLSNLGTNALSYSAFGTSASNVVGSNLVISGSAQEAALAGQWAGGGYSVAPAAAGSMAAYGGALGGALYGYEKGGVRGGVIGGVAGYVGGAALAGGAAAAGGGIAAAGAGAMAGAGAALAAIPVWGWIALAALAIFGGGKVKPSNKGAGGSIDLTSGATSDLWNFTGKKQASQETLDARDGVLTSIGTFSGLLEKLGSGKLLGKVAIDFGERDGLQISRDGGAMKSYGSDPGVGLVAFLHELAAGTEGLDDSVKSMLQTFYGTSEEFFLFTGALITFQDYIKADPVKDVIDTINAAGKTAWQTWQAGDAVVRDLAANFDGSLNSALALSQATADRYQQELSFISQIQGLLISTSGMFDNSIEQIRLSVMDTSQKYDYWRTKTDEAFAALMVATDPNEIQRLSGLANQGANTAYGLLDETQKAGAAPEFIAFFEETKATTTERLNASQALIVSSHQDMAKVIEAAMDAAAAKMMEAAQVQLAAAQTPIAVSVDVSVDTPASVEVNG